MGPADHLAEHGIPVQQDLPVGYNLQDHYGTGALTFTIEQPVSLVQTRYENIPAVLKYAIFGSGPLTVLGGVEVRVFFYQIMGRINHPCGDNESCEGLWVVQLVRQSDSADG